MRKIALPLLLLLNCLCLALVIALFIPWLRKVQAGLDPAQTHVAFGSHPPTQPLVFPTDAPGTTPPPTFTPVPSYTPLPTDTPVPTLIPATSTSAPLATPAWTYNPPGQVIAPVLLYHHIASNDEDTRYYLPPETFRQQMEALRDWGYTSITASYLAQVIQYGGDLPARPFVITFDDGNLDIYTNAFPIMQELGFVGTFYIVADRLDSYRLVNAAQLQEMAAAGWEIGSHSMTHVDLTDNHHRLSEELEQSRSVLENAIGVPILTFAYPFGARDEYVKEWTREVGYLAGMGLGTYYVHTPETLFYLSRIEVYASYDMATFSSLLPWSQPLSSP